MRGAWLAPALAVLAWAVAGRPTAAGVSLPASDEADRSLPDGNALVRSMVDRQRSFEKAIDQYTYDVVSTRLKLDGDGRVKESRVRQYQVFFTNGRAMRKLVGEDGRPLPPDKAAKEDERVLKEARSARGEDRSQTEKDDHVIRLSEVLDRFDFTAVRREPMGDRSTVVVAFQALPGSWKLKHDNVLRALEGRLWIDEAERAVVRAELSNNQKVKFGGGLLASVSSFGYTVDFVPVDDIWLPRRSEGSAAGRLMLVKGFRYRLREEFSNYRRFVVSTEETVVEPPR